MPIVNDTEAVVNVPFGLIPATDDSWMSINVRPGIAMITIICIMAFLLVGVILYKVVDLASSKNQPEENVSVDSADNGDSDTGVASSTHIVNRARSVSVSLSDGTMCRWTSEDNPLNKWDSAIYGK